LVDVLRAELNLNGAYPVLVNMGRLVPQKGQKYLLEAMPDVLLDFPNAKLLLVGDGFLRAELEELRDNLGLGQRVQFLGKRTNVKVFLELSDIFVFPSLFEGSGGNALLEAAALGCPCIASDVGPIPEVIENGHSGILAPPRSSQALAQAIIYLAGHREIARAMGQKARRAVMQKFSIERSARHLGDVYESYLGSHRRTQ
jgi:glycosyltransferase involved in cell wall biosynthesis